MKPSLATPLSLVPWAVLAALLGLALPTFLCTPLWCDVSFYDVVARKLLSGAVHYREVFDTNFPGMHWLHCLVLSAVGWRSEAFRLVDLAIVAAEIVLFLRWVPAGATRWANRGWVALALAAFYLSTGEICHAQRDGWMLLPALMALELRRIAVQKAATVGRAGVAIRIAPQGATNGRGFMSGLLEGLCWGAAMWVKPYAIIPALAVWLASVCLTIRPHLRFTILSTMGLVCGGGLIGAAGIGWLWGTGAWPHFYEIVFEWSREYSAFVTWPLRLQRVIAYGFTMAPWSFAHVVAVPVALAALVRMAMPGGRSSNRGASRERELLAAFYLAWLVQATCLQHPHEYVIGIAILPAIAVIAAWGSAAMVPRVVIAGETTSAADTATRQKRLPTPWGIRFLLVITLFGLWHHPAFDAQRITLWRPCLQSGSTPRIKDALSLSHGAGKATFTDLANIAEFLRGQSVRDGELTCFHASEPTLYLDLNVLPSTRFSHLDMFLLFFPSKRAQMRQELNQSRQRFIVSDLHAAGLTPEQARQQSSSDPMALPPAMPPQAREAYPFREPVVFRAGRYVVHRATGPI